MRERSAVLAPVAAVAGVLGLCCGLPVLLSLGVAGAVAGWSLQSWVLVGLGLVVAALGWARIVRGRRHTTPPQQPGAARCAGDVTLPVIGSDTNPTQRKKHL